jgi:periplasmic protein TonB
MSYKALLFCPDEKTARTVTQVLTELDFQVEACNEPFAAVKKLTTEHFDGVVVDCDNEQNAALLFKSARNSSSNQASLAVAVVEGQSGVAKAFRIGANLVLTKPINVEQSKGTLRVARGLLRKNEAAKGVSAPAASAASQFEPGLPPAIGKPPVATIPMPPPVPLPAAAASISSVFEVENEPEIKPGATEAALLESMRDPVANVPVSRQSSWQSPNAPGPMAVALKRAAEAAGKADFQAKSELESKPSAVSPVSASGAAAAVAPAKEISPEEDVISSEPLETSTVAVEPRRSGGNNKAGLIAAVVLLVAAGGYFAWSKFHPSLSSIPFVKQAVSPARSSASTAPAAQPAAPAIDATSKPSADVVATVLPPASEKTSAPVETVASTAKKSTSITVPSSPEAASDAAKTIPAASDAIVVTTEAPKTAEQKPVPQETADPVAPALNVAPDSGDKAISGLVDTPAAVPHAAPQALRVSQGVSQGLLVKKIAPVYPPQAVQMRVQGSVQILASISKDGNITDVKLINGDPILARSAMDAVKQWKYKPYYLDGQPMEIQTQITVNFSLP